MSEATKAVFLSYASQDAEAARRICEALRAAGVEVWFDQSELRGGDAWDQKIRRQIKECALFVPIISANTNARPEGYFRLEWHLAEQRTYLMAHDQPFLFPVVIDDTPDATARVPEKFRDVQWTRLTVKDTPETLAARVGKLLAKTDAGAADEERVTGERRSGRKRERRPAWLRYTMTLAGLTIGLIYAIKSAWQPARRPAEPKPAAVAPAAPARKVTEARKLALQAETLAWDLMAVRENFRTAEDLCKRALALDSSDAEVWAISAQVSDFFIWRGYDRSAQRLDMARSQAEHALALDPQSIRAGHVQAVSYTLAGDWKEALRLMRALADRAPTDRKVLWGLAIGEQVVGNDAGVRAALAKLHNLPGRDSESMGVEAMLLRVSGRYPEAEAVLDLLLKDGNYAVAYYDKLLVLTYYWADLPAARAFLEKIPAHLMQQDSFAAMAAQLWLMSQQGDKALEVLGKVPREYLEEFEASEPKSNLAGWAHQVAGRRAAAQAEWRKALALVEGRLAAEPTDLEFLLTKANLQAQLGLKAEARETWRLLVELGGSANPPSLGQESLFQVLVADTEAAIATLVAGWPDTDINFRSMLSTRLRYAPELAPIRDDPRIRKLVAEHMAAIDRLRNGKPGGTGSTGEPVAQPDEKSVAVLAFANLSDDKGNEYFSDGISEELLNVLAKIPGLKVAARTSAFYFKGKEVPVPEIAKQLSVAYVVEGSVRKQGDRVRITAQLIKAADGFHVWSDTFTRDLKDIFAVQDEIAGLIAQNLELKMGITAARPTIDLEAYQEYLAGRALFAKAGNRDLQEAVRHFERAVAIEPKFTAAWVQLASAHTQLGRWGGAPTLQAWAAARTAIDRARALEPDSPDVLLALGWILRTADWDWRGAEQAFRRSLQLRPDQPETLAGLAVLLFNIGQKEESFRLGQQAARLDPLNPATQIDLSLMFYLSDDWTESERLARRALQLAPGGGTGFHSILAWSLIKQGRLAEAEAEVALDNDAIEKLVTYGLLAIARGQGVVAREKLAELEAMSQVNAGLADLQNSIAWIAVGLGEKDRPFAALAKARDSRDPSNSWLRSSPYLNPLHSDPRWDQLLHQVGLADDQLK